MQEQQTRYRETYESYLTSDHWKDLRRHCFSKAGSKCEACGAQSNLVGHHLKYRTPLESCTVNDIMCLCWDDHEMFHDWLKKWDKKPGEYNRDRTKAVIVQMLEDARHNATLITAKAEPKGYPDKQQDLAYFLGLKPKNRGEYAHALKSFMKRANSDQMRQAFDLIREIMQAAPIEPVRAKSANLTLEQRVKRIEEKLNL